MRKPHVVRIEKRKIRQVLGKGRIRTLTWFYVTLAFGSKDVKVHISKIAVDWLKQ